jgi:hypothetical protein
MQNCGTNYGRTEHFRAAKIAQLQDACAVID